MKEVVVASAREGDYGARAKKASELPEDVVERIIARMPYPSVFKARCLSERWNLKFSQPSSSSSIESKGLCLKLLPPSSSVESWPSGWNFQKQIALRSSQWPSSCPTYVSQDGILAFDKGFGGWRNIVSLSHFPVPSSKWLWTSLTHCGSLICVVTILCDSYNIFVINGITKCWKRLPQCPGFKERKLFVHPVVRIIPLGVDGYRVLCVYTVFDTDKVHTCIYDSKPETWIEEVSREAITGDFSRQTAYVDGKLYCFGHGTFAAAEWPVLWVYDVDKNSWTSRAVGTKLTEYTKEGLDHALLGCSDKIMIAQHVDMGCPLRNPHYVRELNQKWVTYFSIMIHEVIPGSNPLQVEEVQESPPLDTWGNSPYEGGVEFTSDGECLYFGQVVDPEVDPAIHPDVWLRYHVRSKEWDSLPRVDYPLLEGRICGKGAFAPGLNPFIMV